MRTRATLKGFLVALLPVLLIVWGTSLRADHVRSQRLREAAATLAAQKRTDDAVAKIVQQITAAMSAARKADETHRQLLAEIQKLLDRPQSFIVRPILQDRTFIIRVSPAPSPSPRPPAPSPRPSPCHGKGCK